VTSKPVHAREYLMNARKIAHLGTLPDEELFSELATGLEHVRDSALDLHEQACALAGTHHARGAWILNQFAAEEAAKFLMLLDAARCPRDNSELLIKHLNKRFYSHLARAIYAESCNWRPGSFGEFRSYVERECQSHYLDGPSGLDWIYRNRLIEDRENTLYVDYVEREDGYEWAVPHLYPDSAEAEWHIPLNSIIGLVKSFSDLGVETAGALHAIARRWRQFELTDDLGIGRLREMNWATAEELAGLQNDLGSSKSDWRDIGERWPFPMYAMDLSQIPVDRAVLERQR
jgi:AbiV family abortive infection protein